MGLMKIRRGALSSSVAANALYPLTKTGALTVSNLITDSTRLTGTQGDGAAYPDSSVGVWPAATNLVTNGGFETNTTGWTTTGSGVISIARSVLQAKFGSASLGVSIDGAAVNQGSRLSTGVAAATSTAYTCSLWAWVPTGHTIECGLDQTLSNVYVSTLVTANAVGNNAWQRVILTGTTAASGIDGLRPYFRRAASGAAITFYVDGAQIETGSIATPYIETNGGTASRSAGSITAIPAGVLDETQMWVMARIRVDSTQTGSGRIFSFGDSSNERLEMIITSTTNRTSTLRQTGGAGATASAASGTIAVGDAATYIGGWDANFCYAANNGAALTSAANTSIPTLSATDAALGKQGFASSGYPGVSLKWLAIGRAAPTDALSSLGYAWGNNDPLPHMFPASARLSFLAHFNGDGTFYRRSA